MRSETERVDNKKEETISFPEGVLKIKKGTNPNSSSIGTLVYAFPFAVIGVSGIVAILSALLSKRKEQDLPDGRAEGAQDNSADTVTGPDETEARR